MEGPFHISCRACGEERVFGRYREALKFFGTHAEEGHDVELVNTESHEMSETECTR